MFGTMPLSLRPLCLQRFSQMIFLTIANPIDTQLHGFCDASLQAYAAIVYVRSVYQNDHIENRIVASKTRVSPMKRSTRLELLGAVCHSLWSYS